MRHVKRPLVIAAGAFVAGIAAAHPWTALLSCAIGVGLVLWVWREPARRGGLALSAAAALLWLAAGSLRAWTAFARAAPDHYAFHVAGDAPVRCAAVLAEEPRRFLSDRGFSAGWSAGGDLVSLVRDGRATRVSGKVRLVFESADGLTAGARVEGTGRIRFFAPPANPGERDRAAFEGRRGVRASLSFADGDFAATPGSAAERLRGRIVARIGRVLDEATDPPTAAFLEALLLGVRSDMPPELSRAFLETGTVHLLAVSGLHLVFILGPAAFALRAAGGPVRLRAVLLIAFAWGYGWLVGFAPSVTRACVLATALLAADLAGRPRDFAAALAAAALMILAAAPHQLGMPGFQLSFLACLAIVCLPGKLFPGGAEEARGRLSLVVWPVLRWLAGGIALSAAAWLGTSAVVLHHFHLVTPIVILANLVLSPLFCAALLGGVLLVSAGLAGLPAAPLAAGLSFCVGAIARLAELLAAVPWSHIYLPSPPGWAAAAFTAGIFFWGLARRGGWAGGALAGILAAAGGTALLLREPAPGLLTLDVRHGLCSVLVTDDGKTVVYDCGAYGGRDPTPDVVAPALWSRGVSRIDVLVLSHPHADHASGVGSLLARFPVGAVCVAPGFGGTPAGAEILAGVRRAGISVTGIPAGGELSVASAAWAFPVLHPPAGSGAAAPRSANDLSLVVRAVRREPCRSLVLTRFGPGEREEAAGGPLSLLWTGDLEEAGAEALLAAPPEALRARVLVIPHHGSPMGRTRDLARAVGATFALNSAKAGFASREVLAAYAEAGARVLETARDGAILIEWE